jgi:hypothetical protein
MANTTKELTPAQKSALQKWVSACNACSTTITKAQERRCIAAIDALALALNVKPTDIEAVMDHKYKVLGAWVKMSPDAKKYTAFLI